MVLVYGGYYVKPGAILTNLALWILKIAQVVPKLVNSEETLSPSCKIWKKHILMWQSWQIDIFKAYLPLKIQLALFIRNFSLGIEGYLPIIHLTFKKSVCISGGICSNMSVLRGYFIEIQRRGVLHFTLVATLYIAAYIAKHKSKCQGWNLILEWLLVWCLKLEDCQRTSGKYFSDFINQVCTSACLYTIILLASHWSAFRVSFSCWSGKYLFVHFVALLELMADNALFAGVWKVAREENFGGRGVWDG